ncbi:MAG: membrane protein insertase YidC [Candidatus Paralactobacillus gallistercoris]|uniref:Membrane protein insertase YidC n=1 Tax=Candidatus Paralactobacillus gallistercoris TaxID=2838724 RepID=A0A948TJC7_9LACO|nr:membrane protein insertase YidC [Candidatus Paralactobacillus gallistercoris]
MKNKKRFFSVTLLVLVLALSACSRHTTTHTMQPPTGFLYGTLYKYLAIPIQHFMQWIALMMGNHDNGFGWAIIIITVAVRVILLPLMLNQTKKMTIQQEKMQVLKPQIDILQKHLRNVNTPEEQMRVQQLMMEVYQKNHMSIMPSMGCLTMLIQLPVFSGLYMAIEYSAPISNSSFLHINLGQSNLILTILATLTYVIQGYLSLYGMPESQKQQMKMALLMSPAMTFFVCVISPAGLGLYFLAGGLISILQQIMATFWITPKIKRQVAKEMAEEPPVIVVDENTFHDNASADNTNQTATTKETTNDDDLHAQLRQRNAGKQKRK